MELRFPVRFCDVDMIDRREGYGECGHVCVVFCVFVILQCVVSKRVSQIRDL